VVQETKWPQAERRPRWAQQLFTAGQEQQRQPTASASRRTTPRRRRSSSACGVRRRRSGQAAPSIRCARDACCCCGAVPRCCAAVPPPLRASPCLAPLLRRCALITLGAVLAAALLLPCLGSRPSFARSADVTHGRRGRRACLVISRISSPSPRRAAHRFCIACAVLAPFRRLAEAERPAVAASWLQDLPRERRAAGRRLLRFCASCPSLAGAAALLRPAHLARATRRPPPRHVPPRARCCAQREAVVRRAALAAEHSLVQRRRRRVAQSECSFRSFSCFHAAPSHSRPARRLLLGALLALL